MATNISNQLIWEIVRSKNSFLKKKTNGPFQFTSEPLNVQGINAYKYSSLAQKKALTVEPTEGNFNIDLVTVNKPKKERSVLKSNRRLLKDAAGPKRNNKKILAMMKSDRYRKDLKKSVLRRYTKLYKAQQRARKLRKSSN